MRGELRIDPHVKVLDDHVARRAKARGIDVLVYAPHFTRLPEIRERAAAFTDDDLLVIPAREVFTGSWRDRKHLLAVDPAEPIPDFITLEAAVETLVDQGATILVPHPEFMTVSLDAADVRHFREHLHGVEVYNPKHREADNRNALALSAAVDLPAFGSSYAHRRATVGEVWTTFEAVEPTTAAVRAAFEGGAPRRVERRRGPRHRRRCAAEFGHLFYENSIKKFDRVVLSTIEATHPDHPAYEGRFDDVAVY